MRGLLAAACTMLLDAGAAAAGPAPQAEGGAIPLDLSAYQAGGPVEVTREEGLLRLAWPLGEGERGRLSLDLRPGEPLVSSLELARTGGGDWQEVLGQLEPAASLTAGIRSAPSGRPPTMSVWNVFFDNPHTRPHQTHALRLERRRARVASDGPRVSAAVEEASLGPFQGEVVFTVYPGSRLIHLELVVSTGEDRRAFVYQAGLEGPLRGLRRFVWLGTAGEVREAPAQAESGTPPRRDLAVRHRMVIAEGERGSVAAFPPPHQFLFPRDLTDNLKYVWIEGREGGSGPAGFGVAQRPTGGGNFVPWFNAPPGTRQRLGLFLLLHGGKAEEARQAALRYTRGDRFAPLPGMVTLTSHWHMAVAVSALEARKAGKEPGLPDLVTNFRDMGVNAVHLAEFHGDGHQKDKGPLRLPELESMFSECRRLSAEDLLFIPGEEVNDFLGIREAGKHPGHWMSLFPRPVRWVMERGEGEPFAEPLPDGGVLYRVGSRADMVELLRREKGLAWAAHPRIKASSWTPDVFKKEDFYLSDLWLGGAWKAMPVDLSEDRLGRRGLDLLDDMANWGQRKYLPGEVDVFKIDRTHELYGHMNVNYLRLERLPRFDEGWEPVLDALRQGRFFVTTGEVLIRRFRVAGKESGETLELGAEGRLAGGVPEVEVELEWTFPLRFAEVISGDGERVHRDRRDLAGTGPFGREVLTFRPALAGRRWVRFEVWDVAVNGAFTQPVWLRSPGADPFLPGRPPR